MPALTKLLPPAPYTLENGALELLAIDRARNINRRYAILRSVDLFGFHVVETCWGRDGGAASWRRFAFEDAAEADRNVRQHLLRRATAERRIGVAYRPVGSRT